MFETKILEVKQLICESRNKFNFFSFKITIFEWLLSGLGCGKSEDRKSMMTNLFERLFNLIDN